MLAYLKKIKVSYAINRRLRQIRSTYRQAIAQGFSIAPTAPRLLIVPCDIAYVGGSRGDEAMIFSAIQRFRKLHPEGDITILTSSADGVSYIKHLPFSGVDCICDASFTHSLAAYKQTIEQVGPSQVVVLGADCMDGHYSPIASAILLYVHLLMKAAGIDSILTGFSFNDHPDRALSKMFADTEETFNLRDPLSLRRFLAKTGAKARQTADIAFLLKPEASPVVADIAKDIDRRRQSGATVIGFNFHSMFDIDSSPEAIDAATARVANILVDFLKTHANVHLVMIPHDDRRRLTDLNVLKPLFAALSHSQQAERVTLIDRVARANEIKALCSHLDGVVSGRMHLAIAAMGVATPVFTITYQGKFGGLYEHFGYPQEMMVEPSEFLSPDISERLNRFISELPQLKTLLQAKIADIQRLAQTTFE